MGDIQEISDTETVLAVDELSESPSLSDITIANMLKIIKAASERNAFKLEEFQSIGAVTAEVTKYLESKSKKE
jgi:hypothetical protein